jgi:hypothetical protein
VESMQPILIERLDQAAIGNALQFGASKSDYIIRYPLLSVVLGTPYYARSEEEVPRSYSDIYDVTWNLPVEFLKANILIANNTYVRQYKRRPTDCKHLTAKNRIDYPISFHTEARPRSRFAYAYVYNYMVTRAAT